jgi:hypothetical protein
MRKKSRYNGHLPLKNPIKFKEDEFNELKKMKKMEIEGRRRNRKKKFNNGPRKAMDSNFHISTTY